MAGWAASAGRMAIVVCSSGRLLSRTTASRASAVPADGGVRFEDLGDFRAIPQPQLTCPVHAFGQPRGDCLETDIAAFWRKVDAG